MTVRMRTTAATSTGSDAEYSRLDDASKDSDCEPPHKTRPRLVGDWPMSTGLRWYEPPRRKYSCRELLADRIVNFTGMGLSLLGGPLLIYASWNTGDSFAKQIGFWAFGAGLTTMLTCSAFYHQLSWRWGIAEKLMCLDHIGISAMIMGCYVPVMQMVAAWRTLAIVLSLGLLGWLIEAYKFFGSAHHLNSKSGFSLLDSLQVVRYLVMGWACIVVGAPLWRQLPEASLALYIAGGVTYSLGVVFFVQHNMEFHMPIWHLAVLLASAMFYTGNIFLVGVPLPA